ncbi:MAG TPA: hypothetical protein VLX09_07930 [Stellaceae bacterium]|nr:hypothetical protein [Stellaceae bacterium]
MPLTTKRKSVTGRDTYILTQALAYAIALIDALPPDRQESSNRDDMIRLIRYLAPDERTRKLHAHNVRAHCGEAMKIVSIPLAIADGVDPNLIVFGGVEPFPDPSDADEFA